MVHHVLFCCIQFLVFFIPMQKTNVETLTLCFIVKERWLNSLVFPLAKRDLNAFIEIGGEAAENMHFI